MTVDRVRAELASAIDPLPDVSWRILECTEPSWTDPEEAIVRAVRENAAVVTGGEVVVNLRAGFSDARLYRHAGVPSVVYGVASNGMEGLTNMRPRRTWRRCLRCIHWRGMTI